MCKWKGHRFTPIKKESHLLPEYECTNYSTRYTKDGYGRMVRLTNFWIENHQYFEAFVSKQEAS